MRYRCAHRLRAYTLIELLLVIALLGIAAAMVVPRLVGQDIMTVQAAVRLIMADLSFAQSDALAHQEMRRVHFYDDGRGYAIVRGSSFADFDDPFDADAADYVEDPLANASDAGRFIVDFSEDDRFTGVTIDVVEFDGANRFVTYDALGGTLRAANLPGTGGRIELSMNGVRFEITVSPFTGKLSVAQL